MLFAGDPGNEDEDNEMEGKENRPTSRRKKSGLAKTEEQSTRRSTRNQRRASGASEESDDDEESELSSLDESVDSGPTIPREGISKRSPLRDRLLEPNKPRGKGKIPEGLTNKKRYEDTDSRDGKDKFEEREKNGVNGNIFIPHTVSWRFTILTLG